MHVFNGKCFQMFARRQQTIRESASAGPIAAARFVKQENSNDLLLLQKNISTILQDEVEHKGLDSVMAGAGNKIQSEVASTKNIPDGLMKPFPSNNFQVRTDLVFDFLRCRN